MILKWTFESESFPLPAFALGFSQPQKVVKEASLFVIAFDTIGHVLLHLLFFLLEVDLVGDLLEFSDELFLVVLGAGEEVDDGFFEGLELILEVPDFAFAEHIFGEALLDLLHELLEVDSQQLEQVFLIFFVLSHGELEGVFPLAHVGEVGEGIDPLELLAALDGEFVGGFHELGVGQLDPEDLEEVPSLGENVDVLVVVGHCLVEDEPFGAVAHPLHDLLLAGDLLVGFLLVDVALEVVLVVGLPGPRAHVAEVFSAGAAHEVAAHAPFHRLLAGGTNLSVVADPLGVSFLGHDLLGPHPLLLALAGVVVVRLALEAKDLSAGAPNCLNVGLVDANAVRAVSSRAKLVVSVLHD